MAYFDCIVGGSGKGNTLVVTCADELAGATITCTNGTKTYTKTCPSTAPYEVTFYGLAAGTWTVSATVSGNTYTTTVVVADIEALLGGFNWRTWVDTASQLDSSDYDSLDEVLADELAVRELCLEHACVDYMAEITTDSADVETIINTDLFAKWVNNSDYALDFLYANEIIAGYMDEADKYFYGEWVITDDTTTPPTWGAKGNVPIMTANNAPYGTASGTPITNADSDWFYAFNGEMTEASKRFTTSQYSGYLQYKFVNPVCIKRVDFRIKAIGQPSGDVFNDNTASIKISNDGVNWEEIADISNTAAECDSLKRVQINNNKFALYVKYEFDNPTFTSGTNYISMAYIQFYGRELSVSVPKMTSNTVPYGEAICGAVLSGATQQAWLSFDKTIDSNGYETPDNAVSAGTAWLGYKFLNKTNVKMVTISNRTGYSGGDLHAFISGKLQGRNNDNEEWEDIETITRTNYSTAGITTAHIISNSGSYSQLRVKADTTLSNNGRLHITELQFYGLDYSEREFEEGTTKKWLYDHGVELETMYIDSAIGEKKDSFLRYSKPDSQTYATAMCTTNNPIDISPFSILRAKSGYWGYNSAANGQITLGIVSQRGYTPLVAYRDNTPTDAPNNLYLVVSNVNETNYVGFGWGAKAAVNFDIKEIWLE
jgi:hypothetical protein